jgi:hypothetical protein
MAFSPLVPGSLPFPHRKNRSLLERFYLSSLVYLVENDLTRGALTLKIRRCLVLRNVQGETYLYSHDHRVSEFVTASCYSVSIRIECSYYPAPGSIYCPKVTDTSMSLPFRRIDRLTSCPASIWDNIARNSWMPVTACPSTAVITSPPT